MTEQLSPSELYAYMIQKGLVTREQISECLKIQTELRQLGLQDRSLLALLLEKKYLTQEQLQSITPLSDKDAIPQIPGYIVERKLGQGGMGCVYLARQISMDRNVAIKVLAHDLTKDKDFIRRFHQEARASAALNHRNIISGIDVGEANGYHYFVMEYAEGQTAGELLDKRGAFSEKQALTIVRAITSALNQAHQAKLIHRDIKPDNIMLTSAGEVKLLDFGLAKKIDGSSNLTQLTQVGATIGTPYYISPEQASGDPVDIRSDLYSLGATLFHLVVGDPPFTGKNQLVIMTKHISEKTPDPRTKNPQISEHCARLIFRLMEKDRTKRFQTPQELLDSLLATQQTKSILPAQPPSSDILLGNRTGKTLPILNATKSVSAPQNAPTIPILEVFPLQSPPPLPPTVLPTAPIPRKITSPRLENPTEPVATPRKPTGSLPAEPLRPKAKAGSRRTRKKNFSGGSVLFLLLLLGAASIFAWKSFFPDSFPDEKMKEVANIFKNDPKPLEDPKVSDSLLKQAQIKAFEEFQVKLRSDFSLAEVSEQLQQGIHLESFLQRVPEYRLFGDDILKKMFARVNELAEIELKRIIRNLETLSPNTSLQKKLEIVHSFPETLFKSPSYSEIKKIQEKLLQDYQQWKTQQLTDYENLFKNKQYTQAEEFWKILEPNCLKEDVSLFQSIRKSFESEIKIESGQKVYQDMDLFFQDKFLAGLQTRDRAQYQKLTNHLQTLMTSETPEDLLPRIQEMKQMITSLENGLQRIVQYIEQCRQQKKQTLLLGTTPFNLSQYDLAKLSAEDFLILLAQSYGNEEENIQWLLQKTFHLFLSQNYLLSWKTAQKVLPQLNAFPIFQENLHQKLEKIASDLSKELMEKSEGPLSNAQKKEFRRQLRQLMEEYAFTQYIKNARPKISERLTSLWSAQDLIASLKNNFHGAISLKDNLLQIEYDFKSETQFLDFEVASLRTPSSLPGTFKYHPQGGVYGYGSAILLWKPVVEGDVEIEITCIPAQLTSIGAAIHHKASWQGYYTFFSFNLWQAMNWSHQDILIFSGNSTPNELKLDVLEKQKNSFPSILNSIHQDSFPEENPSLFYFKFSRKKNQLFLFGGTAPLTPDSKPLIKTNSSLFQEGKVGFISASGSVLTHMVIRCSLQQSWFKEN